VAAVGQIRSVETPIVSQWRIAGCQGAEGNCDACLHLLAHGLDAEDRRTGAVGNRQNADIVQAQKTRVIAETELERRTGARGRGDELQVCPACWSEIGAIENRASIP